MSMKPCKKLPACYAPFAVEDGRIRNGHMDPIIHALDVIGTAVFAVTGALAAGRKRMDVFGVVVLGCVTALGGGTMRDLILGIRPVFWITETPYLAVAVLASAGTYLLGRRFRFPDGLLVHLDAVGLAVFTVVGFQRGLHTTHNPFIAIVMGMTTGVAGGMIRDILSAEMPLILQREIYASASLCGAALLAALSQLKVPPLAAVPASAAVTLAIRLVAVRWKLSLPVFSLREYPGDGK